MTEVPLTLESSAFLMLILLWIRASPLSIWAMIFSMSCSSLHRSQNTAAHKHNTSHHMLSGYGWAVQWWRRFDIPEYSMTSSGVLPSTSRAMFSMSSLPHFSLALMNWLKSRLVQIVKPWGYKTHWRELLHKHHFMFLESRKFPAEIYLREEVLLLLQLFFIKWFSFIDLGLLLFLHLGWVGQIGVSWHLLEQWHHAVENLVEIIASEEFLQRY